jgi:hypothetical protein
VCSRLLLAALACVPALAFAGPTRDEVASLCANAEDASHCGRLVEARQLARLPGLAAREGDTLRVTLYPKGSVGFTDEVRPEGVKTYAMWDALSPIDAAVLFVVDGERTGYLLLQRHTGQKVLLPAEPVLSPDRRWLVTADFCTEGCDGEVALWRVTRDGVRKDRSFRPQARWPDATAEWVNPERLVLAHPGSGGVYERTELRLDDARWRPAS